MRSILRYLGTCDGNMEEGSLRCDANVSVRRPGEPRHALRDQEPELGALCMQAIEYEARRQVELVEDGRQGRAETRLFDRRAAA